MKQEKLENDWTEQLRKKLADHEEPAPADLWEQIEARMAKLEAEKRQPVRRLPLWGKWVAAAVFAGMLVCNTYLMWMIGCEGTTENTAQQEFAQSNAPAESQKAPIPSGKEEVKTKAHETPILVAQTKTKPSITVPAVPQIEPENLAVVKDSMPEMAAATVDSVEHG